MTSTSRMTYLVLPGMLERKKGARDSAHTRGNRKRHSTPHSRRLCQGTHQHHHCHHHLSPLTSQYKQAPSLSVLPTPPFWVHWALPAGCVVNMSSAAAQNPSPLLSQYAGTKGYVEHFTASMHREYAPKGIHFQVRLCAGSATHGSS